MVWSYDNALPSDKDKVRALVGDTDSTAPQVDDEAILVALQLAGVSGGVAQAAGIVAGLIASRPGRVQRKRLGPDMDVTYATGDAKALAAALGVGADSGGGVVGAATVVAPYAGGISLAEKDTARQDTDAPRPSFTRRLHGTNDPSYHGEPR